MSLKIRKLTGDGFAAGEWVITLRVDELLPKLTALRTSAEILERFPGHDAASCVMLQAHDAAVSELRQIAQQMEGKK